jgi:hypothetical protein
MSTDRVRATGWVAPKNHYAAPVLFNPYTGEPRDVRDVQSDPQGILIVPPGKVDMLAARDDLTELRQQRDELLAALKQIVLWYECDLALTAEPIKQAKAAIANAEGGAA